MEKINKILDIIIKLMTLSTLCIVFLSFVSYYSILSQYDLISIMTDNGFDYIRIFPVIIPSLVLVFCFFVLIEIGNFLISFFSKDTDLVYFDYKKIEYSKSYILWVIFIFIFSCCLFYFIFIPLNIDIDFLGFYVSLFIFVLSGILGGWYYIESNKREIINIKYKNNLHGAFMVFVSTFFICFLLFFLSVILFVLLSNNNIKYYYLSIVIFISLFVVANYFVNLTILNNYENKVPLLYGFLYKAVLYFVFFFLGASLTNVVYFINQQSYVNAGYIIMNDYKYNFENGIPADFLSYDVKVSAFNDRGNTMNYGFENLNAYPHLGCVLFKNCDGGIFGKNNISIIQRLLSVFETKNNTASVLGVFKINSKTLICPKKLGVDIQDERRFTFGFKFRVKKIKYKKECLFVDNKDLIN